MNARKPDKLRVVYDCAAKFVRTSLDGMLMKVLYLTNNLVGVLTQSHLETIALASNMEAMFHLVNVNHKDRNALKFL